MNTCTMIDILLFVGIVISFFFLLIYFNVNIWDRQIFDEQSKMNIEYSIIDTLQFNDSFY
jgi:hypothetical protein